MLQVIIEAQVCVPYSLWDNHLFYPALLLKKLLKGIKLHETGICLKD
jgi:hypothetical protein